MQSLQDVTFLLLLYIWSKCSGVQKLKTTLEILNGKSHLNLEITRKFYNYEKCKTNKGYELKLNGNI